MDVGVFEAIGVVHRLQHRAWLLRRRAVVEIDERLAVDLTIEDREIGADALDVESVSEGPLLGRFLHLCASAHGVSPFGVRPVDVRRPWPWSQASPQANRER